MGYWNATTEGASLALEDTGMYWGDTPADILGDAVDAINQAFKTDLGKSVTLEELQAGLLFAWGEGQQ